MHSYLDFFPSNCGDVNDEQGSVPTGYCSYEKTVPKKTSSSILADYCLTLARDQPDLSYSRKTERMRL